MEHKLPCEGSLLVPGRGTILLLPEMDRESGAQNSAQTNLVKAALIFPDTSLPFTTPGLNPFVLPILYKWVVSLFEGMKASCSDHSLGSPISHESPQVHVEIQ